MTPEGKVAKYLKERIEWNGGFIRKLAWEGRNDAPDYLIMIKGAIYFVEVKAPGKKPRQSQLYEFKRIKEHSYREVLVIDSTDAVDDYFPEVQYDEDGNEVSHYEPDYDPPEGAVECNECCGGVEYYDPYPI